MQTIPGSRFGAQNGDGEGSDVVGQSDFVFKGMHCNTNS